MRLVIIKDIMSHIYHIGDFQIQVVLVSARSLFEPIVFQLTEKLQISIAYRLAPASVGWLQQCKDTYIIQKQNIF